MYKKLVKRNLSKKYNVISEINISKLGYKGFSKDHIQIRYPQAKNQSHILHICFF